MIRVPFRSLATLVLAVFVSTCSDAPTGAPTPAKSTGPTRIALAATFSKSAAAVLAQRNDFADVSFDHVRVILTDAGGAVVKDTTVVFTPSSPDITLDFTIDGALPGQNFPVELQFLNGAAPIYKGTGTAEAYAPESPPPTTPPVVVVYVGPGATATRIVVAPKTVSLIAPSTTALAFSAFDASNAPVASVPVNWTTSDASIATVSSTGAVTTVGKRGTATITVTSVTGLSDNATVNVSLPPSAISLVSGGGQTGKVGTTLAQAAVVKVTASDGVGVPGVNVNFSPPAGGKVGSTSVVTDAAGQASTSLTLGTTVGSQGFAATTAGLSVGISATATVGDPSLIAIVSGGGQTDTVKKALKSAFVVRVTDSFGNAVGGVPVTWSRTSGSGSLSATSTTSGADGTTGVSYTLGTTVGSETVVAAIGAGATATFTALAISAGPTSIATVSGAGQSGRVGEALAAPFVVKVTDASGTGIGGISVAWTATNGTLAASTTTDDSGNSSNTMTLGTTLGAASATATIGVAPSAKSVSFAATVNAGVVSKMTFGTFPTSGAAGTVLSPLTVELRDALGNLTAATNAVTITIGTNPGGAALGGTVTRNAVAGVATFNDLTLSAGGVGYTLVASSGGPPNITTAAFTVSGGGGLTRTWAGTISADWNVAGNWSGGGVPTSANSVTIPAGTPNSPVLTAGGFVHDLTVAAGASLNLSLFTLQATASIDGGTGPGITGGATLFTTTATLRGVVSNVSVNANTVTLAGPTTINGSLSLFGGGSAPATFIVGQPLNVTGSVTVSGTSPTTQATLSIIAGGSATINTLTTSGASAIFNQTGGAVTVSGTATFNGNSTTGKITGGTVTLNGDFVETGANATDDFAASGTHRVILGRSSGAQSVTFANPTSSHFQDLSFAGAAAVNVATGGAPLTVNGQLISPAGPQTVNMSGLQIHAAGFDVDGLTINNGTIVSTGGTITRFDNVTFAGYAATATPLTITNAGASTPFTFNNDQFLVTPTSGHYMNVTDSSPTDGNVLSITMLNSLPVDGSSQTVTAGGALVNWTTSGATISWTSASGGSWSNPANWNLGRVPSVGDSVVIGLSGTYTVTLDTTYTAKFITMNAPSGTQTLGLSGRTLTVTNVFTIGAHGVFAPSSSTVAGSGSVNNLGEIDLYYSTLAATTTNQGLIKANGTSAINAALTTIPGSIVRLQGDGTTGFSNLTFASSFTNHGGIEMTSVTSSYSAQLTVTTGTLTNASDGTITTLVGAGGTRTITAQIDNQGALVVQQPLALNRSSTAYTSSGTIDMTAAGMTVGMAGTSPSFTNSGAVTIGSGQTWSFTNGTFNQSAGTIGGPGTLALNSMTANFGTAFTNATTAITLSSTTINGPGVFTNATGRTLTLFYSAFGPTATLVNQGTLIANGTSSINGTFLPAAGSILRLQGDGTTGFSDLTFASGFTNHGGIELTSITSGYSAQLTVTAGTLTNASDGTISSLVGAGGGRTIIAQIDNQGAMIVQQLLALNRTSTAYTSSGSIDMTAASMTVTQGGTSPSFTNSGAVTIGSGQTWTFNNGTFNQSAGTIGGPGTLSLNAVAANFTTSFTNATTTIALNSSTVNGPGTITNAPGRTLTLFYSTVGATGTLINQGTLIANGTSGIDGTFNPAAGSIIRLLPDGTTGFSNFTVATGFTNHGTIDLTSVTSGYSSTFTVTAGTLTNASDGTISVSVGSGGGRTISAQLDNQGLLSVQQPLTLNRSSTAYSNSGTIDMTSASMTVNQSGTSPSFTNTGTLTVSPGQTFAVTNGTFSQQTGATLNGGGAFTMNGGTAAFNTAFTLSAMTLTSLTATFAAPLSTSALALTVVNSTINGAATLTNTPGQTFTLQSSAFNLSSVINQGTLLAVGTNTMSSPLTTASGSLLQLQGNGAVGNSNLTIASGFTNNGAIELISTGSSFSEQLTVTSGTLTNAPGATITSTAGTGGGRTIAAQLNNQGTIAVNQPLAINAPSAAHLNPGTITVSNGPLTVNQSGTTPSFTNTGTLAVLPGQTFAVTNGTFTQQTGATLNGGGAFTMNGGTAAFNTAFTLSAMTLTSLTANFATPLSTSALALSFVNSTINGAATLTNTAGQTFTLQSSAFNLSSIINQGTLLAVGTNTISSPLTAASGSLLQLQGNGSVGNSALTIANGFTNNGAIELVSTGSSFSEQLTVTSGTLTNASGATITATPGTGGGRTITAELNNQGTIAVNTPLTINASSAVHINAGTINVTAGPLTVNQGGTSPSFTNTGTLTVSPSQTFAVTSGTFTQQTGATLNGGGAFTMNGGTAAFNTVFTLGAMTLSNLTATFATPLSTSALALSFVNSTINGAATLTNTPGQTFTLQGSAFNLASVVNQGTLLAVGTNTISSPLTAASGSLLQLQGNGSVGNSALTIANGFTNNGAIELVSTGSSFSEQLTVTSGTLTNASGATITATAGTGGGRTITAQLNNQGTIAVNTPLTLNASSATHINAGTINVTAGPLTVNQGGTSPTFTNTGTLTVSPSQTFAVTSGTFTQQTGATLNGGGAFTMNGGTAAFNTAFTLGAMTLSNLTATFATPLSTSALALSFVNSTINGAATLTNTAGQTFILQGSTFNLGSIVNQGTLLAVGASTISSPITTAVGSLLQLQGNGSVGNSALTIATGFTNNGAIELVSTGSSFSEQLTVTSGTLTNASGATITSTAGTGGGRTITAQLDNQGTIAVNTPLTINASSATHINSGTINVTAGPLTLNQGGTTPIFTNAGTVTVSPSQTFAVTNGSFVQQASATLNGGGAFTMTGGTASFNSGFTLATFLLANVSGAFTSDLSTTGTAISFVNSTVGGSANLTNVAGQTLSLQSTTLGFATFLNQGTVTATGTSTIASPLTTAAGSLVQLQGNGGVGNSNLTISNGFTNNGIIELTSIGSSFSEQLTVSSGTLTNASGGTIRTQLGTGGSRTIVGTVNNQGAFVLAPGAVQTLNLTGNFTNTSTGQVSVELGGAASGSRLAISGTATLAGQVNVLLNSGYVPTTGNTFNILTYASHTGDFATYAMAGGPWTSTAAGATAVTVTK